MSEQQNPSSQQHSPGSPVIVNIPAQQQQAPQVSDDTIRSMSRKDLEKQIQEAEERGAKRTLKSLGIEKDQRESALAKVRAGEFILAPAPKAGDLDYKAEYEKVKPILAEHEAIKARVSQDEMFFKKVADDAFAALPEPAQKYIVAKAGEDPRQRLSEIDMLKSSGLLTVNQVVADAKREAKPATTMASPGPSTPKPEITKTPFDRHQELLKEGNKILATNYYRANRHAIESGRPDAAPDRFSK